MLAYSFYFIMRPQNICCDCNFIKVCEVLKNNQEPEIKQYNHENQVIRGTPCERSWESPNLSQGMKEVCLEDLIKPNQVATGKLGYNYPQSSANTLE
jgi:hypothetical protein